MPLRTKQRQKDSPKWLNEPATKSLVFPTMSCGTSTPTRREATCRPLKIGPLSPSNTPLCHYYQHNATRFMSDIWAGWLPTPSLYFCLLFLWLQRDDLLYERLRYFNKENEGSDRWNAWDTGRPFPSFSFLTPRSRLHGHGGFSMRRIMDWISTGDA